MNLNPFHSFRIQQAWEYRSEPESLRTLAPVFWHALLTVVFLALVCAFWFGYQELQAASQAEATPTNASVFTPPWPATQLQATIDAYNTRQSSYQTLSQSPLPVVADPSK
ncbi:MAG: hypothetical protein P4L81_01110 [Candidatus Pacebacteria bacterium]|nr:hypothetical protein [Candidatus Paceibacterota bacterium]